MKRPVQTQVTLPKELVDAVDHLVGQQCRSEYVKAAVAEKLQRDRQHEALQTTAGILRDHVYPEWATPEQTTAWVQVLRGEADDRSQQKLGERSKP